MNTFLFTSLYNHLHIYRNPWDIWSRLALSSFSRPKRQAWPYSLFIYFFCVFLSTTSPYWNGPLIVIVQLQIWSAALQTTLAYVRVAAKYEKYQLKRHFNSDWREMNMWQCVNQRGTVVCLCGLWWYTCQHAKLEPKHWLRWCLNAHKGNSWKKSDF